MIRDLLLFLLALGVGVSMFTTLLAAIVLWY